MEAYLRLDRERILLRTNVTAPDHVVVQDRTLLQGIDVIKGLKQRGWILINSPSPPEEAERFASFRAAFVDASRIAREEGLGTRTHPIVNTAMIGALARLLEMPPLEDVAGAIHEEMPALADANIRAAEEAYRTVCL